MCLTVQNLFNDKEIILGREEILEVVKYALKNNIVHIYLDESSVNYDYDVAGMVLDSFDYTIELTKAEDAVSS